MAAVVAVVAVSAAGLAFAVDFGRASGRTNESQLAEASARPTASPSASPSASPTAGPSASPSPTGSPSTTPSQSLSPLPTATAQPRYVYPIAVTPGCGNSYSHYHHDYPANDIYVHVGCSFVAVTSGRVDEVGLVNLWPKIHNGATRGGLFVSIVGDDGIRYYGSHLSAVAPGIKPGVRVTAGTLLGRTGKTGNVNVGMLHFGISWPTKANVWWVRRGEIYPWPYLDAWKKGIAKSPAAAVRARHKVIGDRGCTNYC